MRYVCRWSGKNRGIRVRCHGGLLQVFWAGRFLASCYCRARRLDHNCSSDRLATGNHARRSGTWRNAYASLSAVWHRLSLALLGKSGFRQAISGDSEDVPSLVVQVSVSLVRQGVPPTASAPLQVSLPLSPRAVCTPSLGQVAPEYCQYRCRA